MITEYRVASSSLKDQGRLPDRPENLPELADQ